MKLEKIRFCNLASLYGEWTIDLTDKQIQDAGIFALSGPVGSGKSTVFDAVRLALFGATARLGKITQSDNEIMTRGTKECFAEVIFSNDLGRFLCRWSQHRGGRNGKLQKPEHRLSRLIDNHSDEAEILTSKSDETKERIRSVLRMDFKHFSRAMILPQGEFACFLQAGPDERAPLLEQITGTGIYAEISRKVHEICRSLDLDFQFMEQSLAGIDPASEEEISEWTRISLAETDAAAAIKLEYDRKTELLRVKKETIAEQSGLIHLQAELPAAARDMELLRTALSESEAEYKNAGRKYDELIALLPRIREADTKIHLQKIRLSELEQTENQQKSALEQTELHLKKNIEKQQSMTEQRNSLLSLLEERREDLSLTSELNGIHVRMEQCQSLESEWKREKKLQESMSVSEKKLQKNLDEIRLKSDNAEKEFLHRKTLAEEKKNQLEQFLEGGTVSAFFARKEALRMTVDTLEKMILLQKKENETEVQLKEQELKGTHLRESVAHNETQRDTKKTLENQLREQLHLLEEKRLADAKIASYEKDRNALQPGTPCPLCGSERHPFVTNIPQKTPVKALEDTRRMLELTQQEISALEANFVGLQYLLKTWEEDIASLNTVKNASAEEWNSLPWKDFAEDRSNPLFAESLHRRFSEDSSALTRLNMLGALIDLKTAEKTDADSQLSRTESEWNQFLSEKKQTEQDLENLSVRQKQTKEEVLRKELEFSKAESLLRAQLQKYSIPRETSFAEAFLQLRKRCSEYEDALQRERSLELDLTRLVSEISSEKETLEKGILEKENLHAQILNRKELFTQLMHSRAILFGEHDPDREEKEAKEKVRAAEKVYTGLISKVKIAEDLLNSLTIRISDVQRRILKQEEWLAVHQDGMRSIEELAGELEELDRSRQEKTRLAAEYSVKLNHAGEQRKKVENLLKKMEEKRAIRSKWECLDDLIGSADGKKYRAFVQSLTFETLVQKANEQLVRFNDRYLLAADSETGLEFNVIDSYRGNEVRSTRNLSGGETFLVSLALALGLSRMARNQIRIDTLFLDEGFGTLDEETLQHALEQLAGLRQSGKLIGIITHAHGIEDAVPVVLRFSSCSGHSSISGPGVKETIRI